MNYKDNIEWLKSLKQQIGKTQHYDLWHFEQVIDETIENLKPLATSHGRLIDVDVLMDLLEKSVPEKNRGHQFYVFRHMLRTAPTIIEAEQDDG